jgi:hypothetical protein
MRPTSPPIITPPKSGFQENAAMKASVAESAGRDASPSGAACDTHASIFFQTVTQGLCCRVRPMISCRFATATMSDAA